MNTPTLKREKVRVGNGEKLSRFTIIMTQCQIILSGSQENLV
jgi:hypothetical protein